MTPLVSIVIGTLDRRWFLQRTIASIREELPSEQREIIVVDGGSTDRTIGWLTRQKDVITIVQHNRGTWRGSKLERRSWGYFMNLGFKAASAPYVCMLSDDCLLVPGAIRRGLQDFDRSDFRVGAVAFYWRNWPEQERYRVGRTFGDRLFVNHGLFAAEALREVGYVDEEAFAFYHADGDLCLRLDAAGWRCVEAGASFVEHFSHANIQLREENVLRQPRDFHVYAKRWGRLGTPDESWSERAYDDPSATASRYWARRARRLAAERRIRLRLRMIVRSA